MNIERIVTVTVVTDNGNVINENDLLMFLFDGKTRVARFVCLDKRSRVVLTDYLSGEEYSCMPQSMSRVERISDIPFS